MWLPYLERLGQPFIILLRNPATFPEIRLHTSRPIVVRRFAAEIDPLIVPSLKTAFYVNTAPKNEHMLRFLELNQVQLNHGDSDKAPSYRRAFRLYDKNFVAGQAAIDRFANHGVKVPRDAFEIVGRPQVESITVAGRALPWHGPKRVLYAPTWFGYLTDSRYSSLPVGLEIVAALIERDCTVIFRPHPWYRRHADLARQVARITDLLRRDAATSGRPHVFGPAAEVDRSLVDCFNAVDAMIADVSSVVPDFLYSEKPFAVVDTQPDLSPEEFLEEFPLGRAAYLLHADALDLHGVLEDLLVRDPKAGVRRQLKSYYLGPFPAACYADGFINAARPYV
jgi:CDP-glycerol glycerophosphotransferase (TagB/SpsB family)